MRILLFSDVHWSTYSSIVRSRGEKYSLRLENLIQSMNWVEQCAWDYSCDSVICLGDFFDKAELDAESVTALNEINWSPLPHTFLVGNHEVNTADLKYSTAHLFNLKNSKVINSCCFEKYDDFQILYLPYFLEKDRPDLKKVYKDCDSDKKKILLSHNDIKGINYGRFISKEGFSVEEIESVCDVCINGHLHNGCQVTDKIRSIGNLTGQNFSEDAFQYSHNIIIVDTDDWKFYVIENPFAFNFYKLEFIDDWNIEYLNKLCSDIKNNAVVTVRCKEDDSYQCLRARFDPRWPDNGFPKCSKVVVSKFIIERNRIEEGEEADVSFSVDHLDQFKQYIFENLGTDDLVLSEVQEICK